MEINDFCGHNHFEFYPQEENESIFRGVVQTKTPYHAVAKPFIFPDHPEWGVTYWDWTLTPLLDQKGEVNFLVFSLNNVTERKKAEDDLKASQEKLRDLYAHLQLAVEAERTKIAREIHDEFGTILTALNIDLSWLEKKLPEDQHTLKERIKKDMEFINSAVKIVQRISSELRPGVLDYLGFSSAVEWQVKEFGNRTGIDWDISVDVKTSEPDKDISIALFRILQESLTNIARYAEASIIKVSLAETDGILTLEVTDDGKGITEEQLSDPRSLGILGIRERIQYLNGDTDIKGIPNKGTTVRVRVPIAKEGCKK
jgi:signal transduction histidine kinase